MKLSAEQVRHVATLARLQLTAEEEQQYGAQLSAILSHVEQLQALDVSGVPPMTHASDEPMRTRPDELQPSLGAERAVQNAPEKSGTSVAVPKIIE